MPLSGVNSQEEYDGSSTVRHHNRSSIHNRSCIVAKRKRKLKTFTTTCPKDYDRHDYKIHLRDGKEFVVEDYEQVKAYWFHPSFTQLISHIEVLDK